MDVPLIDFRNFMFEEKKQYVVFGAGRAGRQIGWYLENIAGITSFCYCDNDIQKQDKNCKYPVYSVQEVSQKCESIFLVAFINNNTERIMSAIHCLKGENINESYIVVIDMNKDYIGEVYIKHVKNYITSLLKYKKQKENLSKINRIYFLGSFLMKTGERVSGGPPGAFYMQKEMIGFLYKNIEIGYLYYKKNSEYNLPYNKFPGVTGKISMTIDLVKQDVNTIYIANDFFSAFGLYIMGKNYCVLHHGQGSMVKEWTLWGKELSEEERKIIHYIERISVENAYKVLFPSVGAEYFFRNSFKEELPFSSNMPLYNTITDFPEPIPVENIAKDESVITFLSIGQMTQLKGIDRIPHFLKKIIDANICSQKVRWIVVADGILKDEISSVVKDINKKRSCIEYINIDYKINHAQIFYLFGLCDIYLMLHRVSIFDFATLEAMYNKRPIILSNISGNDEFNREGNILLVDDYLQLEKIKEYIEKRVDYGELNRRVYDKYFSKKPFLQRYYKLFDELIENVGEKTMH